MRFRIALIGVSLLHGLAGHVYAQRRAAAVPTVGLRDNRPRDYVLQGATVVLEPGQSIDDATVVIEDTSITAVGNKIETPAGFMKIDCRGKTIYPGLIDAWGEADVPVPDSDSQAAYWNNNVTPQRSAHVVAGASIENASKLRGEGITIRLVAPTGGILKGRSCVVLLSDAGSGRAVLKDHAWQHLQLTVPRSGGPRNAYPNSPMGAVALLRQSMYDARWYADAWNAYRARSELTRPETNVALDALAKSITDDTFVVDAPNERMAIRAEQIANEFSLNVILRGSGREYRRLDEIAATSRPILLPVDFPDTPDVKTVSDSRNVTLQDLMHWDLSPTNPARLDAAGVTFCLTTDGLENLDQFLCNIRKAVARGLPPDSALAAMTTVPARLLGIDSIAGRIRSGMLANLMITDGDLFDEKTKVLETWVAGEQFVVSPAKDIGVDEMAGRWHAEFRFANTVKPIYLELTRKGDKLVGVLRPVESKNANETKNRESIDEPKEGKDDAAEPSAKLRDLLRERDRLTASVELHDVDESLPTGVSRLTLVTVPSEGGFPRVAGSVTYADGETRSVDMTFAGDLEPPPTDNDATKASEKDDAKEIADPNRVNAKEKSNTEQPAVTKVNYPLGAYGFSAPLTTAPQVMFRDATVWTCGGSGKVEDCDILVRDGRIVEVGQDLNVPANCRIIDARGKHITPGLIDCHSHMATDGGVNESAQAVTAEVRIGDFIDNSDITIYRQLAGGLTTANILHGSANPIGGQNQVIKLRWGASMDGLRMKEAPPGIKFALGENVKRNQSRYPNTRMGVEQIIRDQLLAAREYDADWRRWRSGVRETLPPRTDLQLEAMAEVQRGQRWIHCHSYRQDEIIATLDVLDEFGIQIGTLQHILEGYKVADRMARHNAMGSAFADWWAYKFEVYDAIPFNGALMHDMGIVVSFNSDNRELGRHLNTEAAKATKYGAVSEEEALKFVTLNPAKQLRIDQFVGSIEAGKQADLVVWSGRPLSTMTRCEQTWIDGRRYFDLEMNEALEERDAQLRARLIQKALNADQTDVSKKKETAEEDRWIRYDVYCTVSGGDVLEREASGQ